MSFLTSFGSIMYLRLISFLKRFFDFVVYGISISRLCMLLLFWELHEFYDYLTKAHCLRNGISAIFMTKRTESILVIMVIPVVVAFSISSIG